MQQGVGSITRRALSTGCLLRQRGDHENQILESQPMAIYLAALQVVTGRARVDTP